MDAIGFLIGFLTGVVGIIYLLRSLAEAKKSYDVREENGNGH